MKALALALAIATPAWGQARDAATVARLIAASGRLERAGNVLGATAAARRAVEIQKELGPADDPALATALVALAHALNAGVNIKESLPTALQALAIREARLPPTDPLIADALVEVLAATNDDRKRCELLAKRAIAIREKALGPDHPKTAGVRLVLAGTIAAADPAALRALVERASAVLEKAPDADPDDVVGMYIMRSHRASGFSTRIALLKRAHEAAVRHGGAGHPYAANVLLELARTLTNHTRPKDGVKLADRAVAVYAKACGGDAGITALAYAGLAYSESNAGEHDAAKIHAERAREIGPAALGEESGLMGGIHSTSAVVYHGAGDERASCDAVEKAHSILQSRPDPDVSSMASALHNTALCALQVRGNTAGARDLFERSLKLYRRAKMQEPYGERIILDSLIGCCRKLGDVKAVAKLEAERAVVQARIDAAAGAAVEVKEGP